MKKFQELLYILFSLVPFPIVGAAAGLVVGGVLGLAVGFTLERSILLLLLAGMVLGAMGGRRLALYLARKQEEKRAAEDVAVIEDFSDSLAGEHLLGLTVLIERPLTDVFNFVATLEHYPQWHIATLAMNRMPTGPDGLGGVYEHQLRGGNGRSALLEITAYEPNQALAFPYRNTPPDFPYRQVRYTFTTTETGTQITHTVELSAIERQPFLLSAQRISIWRDLFTLKTLLEPKPVQNNPTA